MRAPLTSKFLVQPSSAECGGLETGHKRFAPNVPTLPQNVRANLSNFIQDLFWRVRFSKEIFKMVELEVSNEDFKMVEDGLASLAIIKI